MSMKYNNFRVSYHSWASSQVSKGILIGQEAGSMNRVAELK